MIGNARRIRSGHIQRKNYFYFGVQKRLWAFLNHKLYCRFSD